MKGSSEKAEKLFEAFNDIDPKMIEQAELQGTNPVKTDSVQTGRKTRLARILIPIAAAFTVVVASVITVSLFSPIGKQSAAPYYSKPGTQLEDEEASKNGTHDEIEGPVKEGASERDAMIISPNWSEAEQSPVEGTETATWADEMNGETELKKINIPIPEIEEPMICWMNEKNDILVKQISREAFEEFKKVIESSKSSENSDQSKTIDLWVIDENGRVFTPFLPADHELQGKPALYTGEYQVSYDTESLTSLMDRYIG